MIVKITPTLYVAHERVRMLAIRDGVKPSGSSRTDPYPQVVTIFFGKDEPPVYLPEEYTIEEVAAMLNNQCYYKTRWDEMAGDVDVCVVHDTNSRHPESEGPHRQCLKRDPYPKSPSYVRQPDSS